MQSQNSRSLNFTGDDPLIYKVFFTSTVGYPVANANFWLVVLTKLEFRCHNPLLYMIYTFLNFTIFAPIESWNRQLSIGAKVLKF